VHLILLPGTRIVTRNDANRIRNEQPLPEVNPWGNEFLLKLRMEQVTQINSRSTHRLKPPAESLFFVLADLRAIRNLTPEFLELRTGRWLWPPTGPMG